MDKPFELGDFVVVDKSFGNPIGGKFCNVIDVTPSKNCESGWLVVINIYERPIDSNWLKLA